MNFDDSRSSHFCPEHCGGADWKAQARRYWCRTWRSLRVPMPKCRGGGLMRAREADGSAPRARTSSTRCESAVGEFVSSERTLPTVSAREGVAEDSYSRRFRGGQMEWKGCAAHRRGVGCGRRHDSCCWDRGHVWIESGTVKVADRNGTRDLPVPPDLTPAAPPPSDDSSSSILGCRAPALSRVCGEVLRAAMDDKTPATTVPVPTFADGVACMGGTRCNSQIGRQ